MAQMLERPRVLRVRRPVRGFPLHVKNRNERQQRVVMHLTEHHHVRILRLQVRHQTPRALVRICLGVFPAAHHVQKIY